MIMRIDGMYTPMVNDIYNDQHYLHQMVKHNWHFAFARNTYKFNRRANLEHNQATSWSGFADPALTQEK
jgi:hypothetical protein